MASNKNKPSFRDKLSSWGRKHFPSSSRSASPEAGETSRTKLPASCGDPGPISTSSGAKNEPQQSPTKVAAVLLEADDEGRAELEAVVAENTLKAAQTADVQHLTSTSSPAVPLTVV